MSKAKTAAVKYIFLDIVAFTKDRSVEAQSDLVDKLNLIVREAVEKVVKSENQVIFLPTGDGICMALIDIPTPYDIHLQVALNILQAIEDENSQTEDKTRQFQVRIGLNENVDNLVTDINGLPNVAGLGINMAQRIMSHADGGQILVGQTVYETLRGREEYMSSFRTFQAKGKHDARFSVYQYIEDKKQGLNTEVPTSLQPPKNTTLQLTKLAAYYMAHAIKNEQFFLSKEDKFDLHYEAPKLLYFLARDSVERSETSQYETFKAKIYGAPSASLEDQYNYYSTIDYWLSTYFIELLKERHLTSYSECFEVKPLSFSCVFVNAKGRERLRKEWPSIWEEFCLT